MSGILYLVATPIGNLGDITLRAIETFKSVDVVACEDTRRTEILLRHLGIRKPLMRYDEHTHGKASARLVDDLKAGKSIALVTDAGTPAVSDPGNRLVREVVHNQIKVIPIPGPSSVLAAVSASGLVDDGFIFLGFLPRREGRARRVLQEGIGLGKTIVVFESPFRVDATLKLIEELSPAAEVVAARELTKLHEEFVRGTVAQVRALIKERPQKGEFVLIFRPALLEPEEPTEEAEQE